MKKPQVSVIILNWNGKKDTLECLDSVFKSKTPNINLNIHLVDNNSEDKTVQTVQKKYPKTIITQNNTNLGYSKGNNVGIKKALELGADYVVLLNNDTTVTPNTFNDLYLGSQKNNFQISSPKIFFYPGREFHSQSYKKDEKGKIIWYAGGILDWDNVWAWHRGVDEFDHGQFDRCEPTEFATGCCMLIHSDVFKKIGFLDAQYPAYFEDNDFCQRALAQKIPVGFVGTSHMWHKNAGSTGGSGSKMQKKFVDKSRLIFGIKHAPMRAKLALVKHQIKQKFHG